MSHSGPIQSRPSLQLHLLCVRFVRFTGNILSSLSLLVLTHCLLTKGVEKYGHQGVIREESNERQRQGQRASADAKNSMQLQTNENKQVISYLLILFLSLHIVCLEREWRSMVTNGVMREESNERQRSMASADAKNSTQLQTIEKNRRYLIFTFFSCPYTLPVWKGSGEVWPPTESYGKSQMKGTVRTPRT